VSLSASNVTGQVVTTTKQMIIEVFATPDANFDTKPKLIYIPSGILYTKNNTFDANRYEWDFGDGGFSDLPEPQHIYENEGSFTISMIAISDHNCRDTATVKNAVRVQKGGEMLVPNAFSPNLSGSSSGNPGGGMSDGKNDIFLPVMRGVTQFEMLIFNRWGQLLFESRDPQIGWDGYFQGRLCEQDVYVYKLTAEYVDGQRIVRTGDVNLIR
ncbi:MAG TPA: gliding motility-associated C-terminal domain-containing protein, partial [Cyclobacteriaceae bacterium]|nr:gliding motility-associated C-terminal domain-containing protein [Cyclobacteriaceae bacterium]